MDGRRPAAIFSFSGIEERRRYPHVGAELGRSVCRRRNPGQISPRWRPEGRPPTHLRGADSSGRASRLLCYPMTYPSGCFPKYTMDPPDGLDRSQSDSEDGLSAVRCEACQSVLRSNGQQDISVLLLDQLTTPVVGCDEHLEQFAATCGFTTEGTADLLQHRPAGGIRCPSCRLASHSPAQPMIPVQGGAIAVIACPEHQTEVINRFQTGLQTQQDLTSDLESLF